jgi:hypothetical protein
MKSSVFVLVKTNMLEEGSTEADQLCGIKYCHNLLKMGIWFV